MKRNLALYYRDAAARSSWGDYRALLIYAIDHANQNLLDQWSCR